MNRSEFRDALETFRAYSADEEPKPRPPTDTEMLNWIFDEWRKCIGEGPARKVMHETHFHGDGRAAIRNAMKEKP